MKAKWGLLALIAFGAVSIPLVDAIREHSDKQERLAQMQFCEKAWFGSTKNYDGQKKCVGWGIVPQ